MARHPHPELFEDLDGQAADRLYQYLFYTPSSIPARGSVRSTPKIRALGLRESRDKAAAWPSELAIDPYVGCSHRCLYCPAPPRLRGGEEPRPARGRSGRAGGFDKSLRQDLRDLELLDTPPLPVLLSRETDPLQAGTEGEQRITERVLAALSRNAERFSRITLRTRNPAQLLDPEGRYQEAVRRLPEVTVEVSASLLDEERRRIWEPGAPSVASRLEALAAIKAELGLRTALRVSPLLPLEPLSPLWFRARSYQALGCPGAGPDLEEIGELLERAARAGVSSVSLAPLTLPCGRGARSPQRKALGPLFRRLDGRYAQRGGAFRLAQQYVDERLLPPVIERVQTLGLPVSVERVEL